jgi:hypothetical protein
MKKVFLIMSIVLCVLMGTAYAEQAIKDVGSPNFVSNQTGQHYDYRNNAGAAFPTQPLPGWLETSKGEYYMFQAMIKLGGSLTSFDNIISVRVESSDEPKYEYSLIEYPCDLVLENVWKQYLLDIRYYTWLRTATWTYTMRYRDGSGNVHIQTCEKPGDNLTIVAPWITGVGQFPYPMPSGSQWMIAWTKPATPVTPVVLVFDDNGCLVAFLSTPYEQPPPPPPIPITSFWFDVTDYRGKVVRAENRIYDPVYGLIATSLFYLRVSPLSPP